LLGVAPCTCDSTEALGTAGSLLTSASAIVGLALVVVPAVLGAGCAGVACAIGLTAV
jgi:hypothetical protein